MILTDVDYDATQDFREALYSRLRSDMDPGTSVLIVGQSLADEDLREIVRKTISINQKALMAGRITFLLYTKDENRAKLFELRGIKVAFGGFDDLFEALSTKLNTSAPLTLTQTIH